MPDFWIDSNATGDDSGGSWTNAFPDTATYLADAGSAVGDEVWYASDHLEQTAANTTLTYYDLSRLMSVNSSTDDLEAGARVETTTGIYDLIITSSRLNGGILTATGLAFAAGDELRLNGVGVKYVFDHGKLELLSTANADIISMFADGVVVVFNNGEIKLNKSTQYVRITGGSKFQADNLTITVPSSHLKVFDTTGDGGGSIVITNSDLSASTITGVLIEQSTGGDDVVDVFMSRVLIGAGYNIISDIVRTNRHVNLYSVGTANEYYSVEEQPREGNIVTSTQVKRTGGATYDGSAGVSMEFQPNSTVIELSNPLSHMLSAPTLDLSAGSVVVEIHILLQDSAGTPISLTDMNCVLKAVYPDATDLALGKTVSSTTKDVLDTPADLSTETVTFTGTSGTTKQHIITVTIPQNASMDAAVCELWLELSVDIPATTEMFVCPAHSLG